MIDKLELLLALAKEKHFGRAAEACGVTQPTMSMGLKQLEEILGVTLVHRGSRFLGFTPEGERVLDWARRIVGDTRAMREEIDTLKQGLSGEIRIAAIPPVLGIVASLTTPFRARHPNVRFRIVSCTATEVLALLENLEVDAGLTYLDNEPLGKVRTIPLYDESYRLLTAPDGPYGDRDQVTWHEVGQLPLCLPTPDMQISPDHRSRIAGGRNQGDANAHFKLGHRSPHPRQDRAMGQCDAGEARGNAGAVGCRPEHPDCRSSGDPQNRTGHSTARDDDFTGRRFGRDRAGSRADARYLIVIVRGSLAIRNSALTHHLIFVSINSIF